MFKPLSLSLPLSKNQLKYLKRKQNPEIEQHILLLHWLVPSKAEFWVRALQYRVVVLAPAPPEPHLYLGGLPVFWLSPEKQRQEGESREWA